VNGTALTGRTGLYSGNRFDYRASIDYRFSPEILAYATVSTGFKGGGIAPRPFNAAQAVPFGPEKLTAYEIGVKTDLFDRKVRLNISAYLNKFSGAQLTLLSCPQFGGPGPCAVPQNAGNADVKGLEAELLVKPMEGCRSMLRLRFSTGNGPVLFRRLSICRCDFGLLGQSRTCEPACFAASRCGQGAVELWGSI
jgi:iron complex outermembrane receptor protein